MNVIYYDIRYTYATVCTNIVLSLEI